VENTHCAHVFHSRQWSNYNIVYCAESVVANKAAMQSSTYNDQFASLAVDGSFNLTCCSSCMSTGSELMPWWQVDLANFYHVIGLELFTRTDLDCQLDHSCGLYGKLVYSRTMS